MTVADDLATTRSDLDAAYRDRDRGYMDPRCAVVNDGWIVRLERTLAELEAEAVEADA